MESFEEKLTVVVGQNGVVVKALDEGAEIQLRLTASEALMLLDILENERRRLEGMAREASPFPFKMDFHED